MTGLIALLVLGGLLTLVIWVFSKTHRTMLDKGKSRAVASAWAVGAVVALSLPLTWDAIPTWIAFEYYAHKEAGLTVFKTLEQWKAENPGVADTLEPYGKDYNDSRMKAIEFENNETGWMLNARFSYGKRTVNKPWGIREVQEEIRDQKTGVVMVRYIAVFSGNRRGFAGGGDGWWKFWLLHSTSTSEQEMMLEEEKREFQFLGVKNG